MSPRKRLLIVACLVFALALPAFAAQRTATLHVDNMTCASCPYIVEKALTRVGGVAAVEVSYENSTATVTFDDARTDINALTRATANAGYPSRPIHD